LTKLGRLALRGLSLTGAVRLRRVFAPAKAAGARSGAWAAPGRAGSGIAEALERSPAVCQRAGASTALGICQVGWPMRADEAR